MGFDMSVALYQFRLRMMIYACRMITVAFFCSGSLVASAQSSPPNGVSTTPPQTSASSDVINPGNSFDALTATFGQPLATVTQCPRSSQFVRMNSGTCRHLPTGKEMFGWVSFRRTQRNAPAPPFGGDRPAAYMYTRETGRTQGPAATTVVFSSNDNGQTWQYLGEYPASRAAFPTWTVVSLDGVFNPRFPGATANGCTTLRRTVTLLFGRGTSSLPSAQGGPTLEWYALDLDNFYGPVNNTLAIPPFSYGPCPG